MMRCIPADGFQTAVLLSLLVILGAVTETVSQLVSSGQCPMRVTTELIDATRVNYFFPHFVTTAVILKSIYKIADPWSMV